MKQVKTSDLANELVERIETVKKFSDKTFYVYNLDELEANQAMGGFPLVGVVWNGSQPIGGNQGDSAQAKPNAVSRMMTTQFMVIVAIDYDYRYSEAEDRKDYATDILDEIKQAVLGYIGVNMRPWKLAGEAPADGDTEGVIWYSQVWETSVVVSATHRN